MLVPSLSFPLCCSFSPLYFLRFKSLLSKITSLLTLTPEHSAAIFLTNSSFHILCLDNAMKYNQFVRSYTGGWEGVWVCMHACMCMCVCVCTSGVWVLMDSTTWRRVWGLDQCRVIITEPLLCFRDPLPMSFDLSPHPLPVTPVRSWARDGQDCVDGIPYSATAAQDTHKQIHTHHLLLTLPHTFCCLFSPLDRAAVRVRWG